MKTQTSSLTRKAVDQLIYKYAPILYFNTAEKYVMTGVDWLLERSNVVDNTTHVAFQATPENLPTGIENRFKYQLVSAEFLPKEDRPIEPVWLNFLNRWGKSDEAHLTAAAIRGIIKSAFGPIVGKILEYGTILEPLVEVVLTHFVKENQNGPTGPKAKEEWLGVED